MSWIQLSRSRISPTTGALLLCALVAAPSAAAGPAEDYQAVRADYQGDGDVTACLFTRQELQNAKDNTPPDVKTYDPNFTTEVDTEIQRHATGGCTTGGNGQPGSARLAIARIRSKGQRESVTIRNKGKAGVGLRGYVLRDRSGNKIRLPRVRLGSGRSLRVFTGCARGRQRPTRRGARFFACLADLIWDNRGDVVKVVSPTGKVVAQRGYGRRRAAKRI